MGGFRVSEKNSRVDRRTERDRTLEFRELRSLKRRRGFVMPV